MRTLLAIVGSLGVAWVSAARPATAQTLPDSPREARYRQLLRGASLIRPPVVSLDYTADGTRLHYSVPEADSIASYSLELSTGEIRPSPRPAAHRSHPAADARPRVVRPGEFGRPDIREVPSPDGARVATLLGPDAAVREVGSGLTRRITFDGTPDRYWGYDGVGRVAWAWWSPDGGRLALRGADMRGVDSVPMVRWLESPPRWEWLRDVHNVRTGRRLPREELLVWHADADRLVPMRTGDPEDAFLHVLGWRGAGSELLVLRLTRDYRDVRLLALDPESGRSRTLLAERHETCFTEPLWATPLRRFWPVGDGERFVWKSDVDGWGHLYLHAFDGGPVARLTSGAFEVEDVVGIDEEAGWVYFTARTDREQPWDVHVHRVRLDGSGLSRITEGRGLHAAELIPGSDHIEVWRRRVDHPTELQIRRRDGTLVRTVAKADIGVLRAAGWTPPEEFTVKAADGTTELRGVMFKPGDFDPSERYPVVEFIYGGPVLEYAPRALPYRMFPHALAQLGFVVVALDARGTPGRGRAFLEAGFDRPSVVIADHAGALRQLGERHAFLDLDRVGIIGQSWGAQFTTRALLLAPDVYGTGIAVSGGWWNDPERGEVKATVYEQCAGLKRDEPVPSWTDFDGDLLVIHGTADANLSGSTDLMRWLDAGIEAGKYIDLVILPDRPHSLLDSDPYVWGAVVRYFGEHLKPGGYRAWERGEGSGSGGTSTAGVSGGGAPSE